MKPSDFKLGMAFICGPFWWRCTDVGTRTVTAISLVEDDPVWYEGPPYMVQEVVLDETELEDAYLTEDEKIRSAMGSAAGRSCFPFQFGHTGCVDLTHNRRSIVQSPAVCEQSGEGFLVGDIRQFPQAECEPF